MKFIFTILICCMVAFQLNAAEIIKEWSDNSGEHKLVIKVITDERPAHISVVDKNKKGKHYWNLYDYIPEDCDLDINLALSNNSIEVKDIFNDGNHVVLFAYFIGCLGGIDNVDAKYFAYYKGEKYSIKGRNTLILGNDKQPADQEPVASKNLLKNPTLLKYMQSKWPDISTQTYGVTSQCVPEFSEIELEGKLTIQTYPGPPNYESIEEGDRKMDVWVLHLDKPVPCIQGVEPDNDGEQIDWDGGSFVRIIAYDNTNLDLTAYENQNITIKGRIRAKSAGIDLLPMVLDSISMFNNVPVTQK